MQLVNRGMLDGVNPRLFSASIAIIVIFAILGAVASDLSSATFTAAKDWALSSLRWYYIFSVAFFLIFVVGILLTRYGNIRLGDDDERPEFTNFAWFAMLFSAGMGIGLIFWSIAEPIYHFQSNPFIEEAEQQSAIAADVAMRITFFHWGLHPWALYVVVGLCLAYAAYRLKLPLTIRSALYPLLGARANGWIGSAVDVLAIFATVFGVATSLGLGVQQLNTGLATLTGIPQSKVIQLILIVLITIIATISVVSGLGRGIKLLSIANVLLSLIILLLIFVLGPSAELLLSLVDYTGNYLAHVVPLSIWINPDPDSQWQNSWTTFYWAWWVAWAPFVGLFIARISRGRTVREFIVGVLLVPTAVGLTWLTFFGATALDIELNGVGGIVQAVNDDVSRALYVTLEKLSTSAISGIAAVVATLLILTYFITSSDSGTLVVTTILSGGNPHPAVKQRIIWGVSEGAVAGALLIGGGLSALQTASIVSALPFSIVMLLMVLGLLRSFSRETVGPQYAARKAPAPGDTQITAAETNLFKDQMVKRIAVAAANGDTRAQIQLGTLYEMGQGVARDYRTAAMWYQKAIKLGDTRAKHGLLRLQGKLRQQKSLIE